MKDGSKVSASEVHGGTRCGTGLKRERQSERGSKGGEISESDSLSGDRINRVHEVSEEVTCGFCRENNSLPSFVSFSRVSQCAGPFVVSRARVRMHRGLSPCGCEPRRPGHSEGIREKEAEKGGGGSEDNNGKGAVTFDSGLSCTRCALSDAFVISGGGGSSLPPDFFIISPSPPPAALSCIGDNEKMRMRHPVVPSPRRRRSFAQ